MKRCGQKKKGGKRENRTKKRAQNGQYITTGDEANQYFLLTNCALFPPLWIYPRKRIADRQREEIGEKEE